MRGVRGHGGCKSKGMRTRRAVCDTISCGICRLRFRLADIKFLSMYGRFFGVVGTDWHVSCLDGKLLCSLRGSCRGCKCVCSAALCCSCARAAFQPPFLLVSFSFARVRGLPDVTKVTCCEACQQTCVWVAQSKFVREVARGVEGSRFKILVGSSILCTCLIYVITSALG